MSTFSFESFLLITIFYLLGAVIGCGFRKIFSHSASILHSGHGDVLAGAGALAAGVAASRITPADGEASVKIRRAQVLPDRHDEDRFDKIAVSEKVSNTPVKRETITFSDPPKEPEPVIIVEKPEIDHAATRIEKPVVDDLTKIKGVGLPIALELKRIGVTRFQQVAKWTDKDIAEVSHKLGFSGRIERENWMAQAKILAMGDELEFTTHQLSAAERKNPKRRDR